MPAVPQSRRVWIAVFATAAVLLAAAPANAASRLCRQLETALSQSGGGGMARAYDKAIAAQTAAIATTRARLAASACSPSFFGQSGCNRLQATLRDMRQNLLSLRRTRSGLGASGDGAEGSRLLASLEANGCRAEGSPKPVPVRADVADSQNPAAMPQSSRRPRRLNGQPFCVRTCDGYFFPMTRTTAPVEDQTVCEAACPGTPMEVFYRSRGVDAGGMISGRNNLAYSKLETANLFRDAGKPRPLSCGCNMAKSYQVMSKPQQPVSAEPSNGVIGTEVPEEGTDSKPEQAGAAGMKLPLPSGLPETAADRKVRVVGPTFLPAPKAAEAQPVPAPTPAP